MVRISLKKVSCCLVFEFGILLKCTRVMWISPPHIGSVVSLLDSEVMICLSSCAEGDDGLRTRVRIHADDLELRLGDWLWWLGCLWEVLVGVYHGRTDMIWLMENLDEWCCSTADCLVFGWSAL